MNELSQHEKALIHMFSSFVQITISMPFSYPIDTIKSRIQTQHYKNYTDVYNSVKTHGILQMYRGVGVMYINLISKQPLKLTIFEHIQNPILAGASAGSAGLIIGVPMSFIKTNYQVNSNFKFKFSNLKTGFIAWRYEIAKELSGNTAFYSIYKLLKNYNLPNNESHTSVYNLCNGMIAGSIGTYISYPIDVMKSRKQTIEQTLSLKQIVNNVLHMNGHYDIKNFWKGVTPTAFKHAVIGGFGMMLYEHIKTKMYYYVANNKN